MRRDTLFDPYHWPGINDLTRDALDPVSRIAGLKHTPVALYPGATPPLVAAAAGAVEAAPVPSAAAPR